MPSDHARMGTALQFIANHRDENPSLDAMARAVGLSPYHFQRLFRRWVGISPKRYLQTLTVADAKPRLRRGDSLLEVAYDVGLSGSGRLHDLFVSVEAVTPGEYKARGELLNLRYGVHLTPFGPCCIALSEKGICNLFFLDDPSPAAAAALLREEWPRAEITAAPDATAERAYRIFHGAGWSETEPFHLHLRGTNFQVQVWRALLQIPAGETVSYGDVAEALGRTVSSARAVGNAIGANPVAFLIPCHRAIRNSGALGGYRWGLATKRRILSAEGAAPSLRSSERAV